MKNEYFAVNILKLTGTYHFARGNVTCERRKALIFHFVLIAVQLFIMYEPKNLAESFLSY